MPGGRIVATTTGRHPVQRCIQLSTVEHRYFGAAMHAHTVQACARVA
jgi:hypothetical protein